MCANIYIHRSVTWVRGKEMEKVYILNSPILTDWGRFEFWKIERNEAAYIVKCVPFVSAIGHEGTANLLSRVLDVVVPTNRIQIKMDVGDRAIVFRLLERLPEGKVLTEDELVHVQYEFGLMKRLPDKEPEPLMLCPRCGGHTFRHDSGLLMCVDASCGWKEQYTPSRGQRGSNW